VNHRRKWDGDQSRIVGRHLRRVDPISHGGRLFAARNADSSNRQYRTIDQLLLLKERHEARLQERADELQCDAPRSGAVETVPDAQPMQTQADGGSTDL
jgi:hypothetical protein